MIENTKVVDWFVGDSKDSALREMMGKDIKVDPTDLMVFGMTVCAFFIGHGPSEEMFSRRDFEAAMELKGLCQASLDNLFDEKQDPDQDPVEVIQYPMEMAIKVLPPEARVWIINHPDFKELRKITEKEWVETMGPLNAES